MPRCRIYFFTYKRNYLISRSIESLLKQTFTDWICEIHNDCPDDKFPEEYITSLNDPRFIIKNHLTNLGPTKSFNLAYSGCSEEYATLLEDDNWWEPSFLAEMISIMDQKPNLEIAWSNMRVWKENLDNIWKDTGKTTWPEKANQLFSWQQNQQAIGALHSNGAMIYRGKNAKNYLIPEESLFDAVELIRERSFKHPIYLNSKILANFSITTLTNRNSDSWKWTACQAMLIASLIACSGNRVKTFQDTLSYYRLQKPSPVPVFFIANLFLIRNKSLYRYFNIFDWLTFIKWILGNGFKSANIKQYLLSQKNVYQFLLKNTCQRSNESSP